jgi:hypothetical protein
MATETIICGECVFTLLVDEQHKTAFLLGCQLGQFFEFAVDYQ